MRVKVMAANWKMNKTVEEALAFLEKFKPLVKDAKNEIIIAPPFTALSEVKKSIEGTKIKLAAQNINENEEGAYTGEISPMMAKELAEYTILGHSERREYFNETDVKINEKIKIALKNNLKVILCIGETLEQREKDETKQIVEDQLKVCLEDIKDLSNIIIAYEPVWAIGTGKTATPEQAEEVHKFIREKLKELYDGTASEKTTILYGGSMKPQNVKELLSMPNIDGGLVGGASLDQKSFAEMCNS